MSTSRMMNEDAGVLRDRGSRVAVRSRCILTCRRAGGGGGGPEELTFGFEGESRNSAAIHGRMGHGG